METKAERTVFMLESGDHSQDVLVAVANGMGDCDNAADLAEIVNILDRVEGQYADLLAAAEAALGEMIAVYQTHKGHTLGITTATINQVQAAIAAAKGGAK